jgi:hypothetical protein
LLSDLKAEIRRIEAVDFSGRPPAALHRVLADSLAIGQEYIDNEATERVRGWDALKLLRDMVRRIRRCREDWKRRYRAADTPNVRLRNHACSANSRSEAASSTQLGNKCGKRRYPKAPSEELFARMAT